MKPDELIDLDAPELVPDVALVASQEAETEPETPEHHVSVEAEGGTEELLMGDGAPVETEDQNDTPQEETSKATVLIGASEGFTFDETVMGSDSVSPQPLESAVIEDVTGASGGNYLGSLDGDIFFFTDCDELNVTGFAGGDIITVSMSSGRINLGDGGDIVLADNFTGAIDLGNDSDGDIVILTNCGPVKILNYDADIDIIIA